MATAGLAADPSRFSRSAPETSTLSELPDPLVGGSGGGGGGGWMFFGVQLGGGDGGDGGGAIRVATPGAVTLGGTVRANGGNGSWGFTNVGGTGGPGGGGSGGNVQIIAETIEVLDTATVQAIGGWGGCLSTEPCDLNRALYSELNNGGTGFFDLTGRNVTVSSLADIQAVTQVQVVPLPASLPLLLGALLWLPARRAWPSGRPPLAEARA